MKKFFITVLMLLAFSVNNSSTYAQSVVREGNTFHSVKQPKAKGDTILTKFKWEDSKGNNYPIIVSKKTGACYVWRRSNKTGKMYRSYLGEDISKAVCKELGIEYIPKKK